MTRAAEHNSVTCAIQVIQIGSLLIQLLKKDTVAFLRHGVVWSKKCFIELYARIIFDNIYKNVEICFILVRAVAKTTPPSETVERSHFGAL